MSTFLHGWRPKTGCVLLVMAVPVVGMWLRSAMVYDQCTWSDSNQNYVVYSLNGEFGWRYWESSRRQQLSLGSVQLGEDEVNLRGLLHTITVVDNASGWTGSYCFIGLPLTLLSAILLLWKPLLWKLRKKFVIVKFTKLVAYACFIAACGFIAFGAAWMDRFSVDIACGLLVIALALRIAVYWCGSIKPPIAECNSDQPT